MTLGEMLEELQGALGGRPSNVAVQRRHTTALNRAGRRIHGKRMWDWLWTTATVTTSATSVGIPLPADCRNVGIVGIQEYGRLLPYKPDLLDRIERGMPDTVGRGTPVTWGARGGLLYTGPYAAAVFNLEVGYWRSYTPLALVTDEPIAPEDHHGMWVDGAMMRLAATGGFDRELRAQARHDYDEGMVALMHTSATAQPVYSFLRRYEGQF